MSFYNPGKSDLDQNKTWCCFILLWTLHLIQKLEPNNNFSTFQRAGKSTRYHLMYAEDAPFESRLEEATVLFYEPTESKTVNSCRLPAATLSKLMKAYEEIDSSF